jgi:demethylmenaquinone methyltransferase/2-methoxy-6-polyprenyl-1,4-benzoquinol methylase
VLVEDKEQFIHKLFSRIAQNYDFLNDMMTLYMHRNWKRQLIKIAGSGIKIPKGARVLDLCTGTGDIAEMWIDDPRVTEIAAIDSCAPMLTTGYAKLQKKYGVNPPKIHMIEADALEIPFEDNYFDAITVGFGLRNVKDLDKAIMEILRVLKPGAVFASLDLGHPYIPLIDGVYKNLFLKLVPVLGSSLANDKAAYEYLVNSLETWPSQRQLSDALYRFGFTRSYYKDLMLGAIAIVVGEK